MVVSPNPPYFQHHLFRYLDLNAPTLDGSSRREFSNLVLLFHELTSHDVFSHDSYLCQLISRGDLTAAGGVGVLTAAAAGGGVGSAGGHERSGGGDTDADGSFEDSKINEDLSNLLNQIKEGNQLGDHPGGPFSPPTPGGTSKSDASSSLPDLSKLPRHVQYVYHFPLAAADACTHEVNQRHVLLYGAAPGGSGASSGAGAGTGASADPAREVKKLCKDIMKLFGKKMSIDVSDGGKVNRKTTSFRHGADALFDGVVHRFQRLSYFDQHAVTHQCGQAVVDMLTAFAAGNDKYLPVAEHISFLMDLAGLALNIQEVIDWSLLILKELPGVETQLQERSSCLTRNYTTTLALYIVGVLSRYHSVVILNSVDVTLIFDQLAKVWKINDGRPALS